MFAGEHTSLRWQGYMNGGVESGQRAAAEIAALPAEMTTPGVSGVVAPLNPGDALT